jgi:3-dehydroquinate dehydratase-1
MKTLRIRNMVLADGIPKICVPLTETSESRLLIEAENILSHPADLAEWRIDFYEDADNPEKVIAILQKLRSVLKDMPILATYRTASEGGNREISEEAYKALLKGICAEKAADIIDVEIKRNQNTVKQIIETAQQHLANQPTKGIGGIGAQRPEESRRQAAYNQNSKHPGHCRRDKAGVDAHTGIGDGVVEV